MTNPITDYKSFFSEAKQAVAEARELQWEEIRLSDEEANIAKDIENESRILSDRIASTIAMRRNEVSQTYDDEINKAKDNLKKVREKREKAKHQGIQERIKEETIDLIHENRDLKTHIKDIFNRNSVPGFCNSKLYYALYFPHRAGELLTILITFLICFALLPIIVFNLIPERETYHLIIIYLSSVIIFGGLYMIIGNITKIRHLEILKEGRRYRDDIESNKRKIKVIIKSINNDKDEKKYDLASYDDEIAHIEQELADISMKKQEALNTFESVTKNIIVDEINESVKPRMDIIYEDHKVVGDALRDVRERLKEKNIYISDHFEVYLGKDFLDEEKIDALAEIMDRSIVTNLSEAIEEYNNQTEE